MLKGELYEYVNYISISQLPKKKKKKYRNKTQTSNRRSFPVWLVAKRGSSRSPVPSRELAEDLRAR